VTGENVRWCTNLLSKELSPTLLYAERDHFSMQKEMNNSFHLTSVTGCPANISSRFACGGTRNGNVNGSEINFLYIY
jgi:hypothetical protein